MTTSPTMKDPRRAARGLLAACALALAAAPGAALAQGAGGSDSAAADALFDAAKKLSEAGNHAEACPKFEASYKLDRTLGTLLNMADCHEKIGAIARAWAEWGEGAELAGRAGDDRAGFAKGRREALAPRLPKLEVKVKNPRPGLTVHRDGTVMAEGTFGVPLPIDPGKHVIAVRRGEQPLTEKTVEATEGKTETIELDLAAIEKAAPAPAPAKPGEAPAAPPAGKYAARRNIALVVGGAGVAALIGAGVIEAIAFASKPKEGQCVNNLCLPEGYDASTKAKSLAEAGAVVGIIGLAAVGTGAALLISIPSSASGSSAAAAPKVGRGAPARRAWISPWAGPGGAGVAMGGAL